MSGTRGYERSAGRPGLLPTMMALAAVTVFSLPEEVFAQRRGGGRGSVRSVNRGGGSYSGRTPGSGGSWSGRYGSGTTSRSVSGDRSTRSTDYQTRSGESVSGTRDVTRSGDTVTVDRNASSTSGAAVSKQKEYEFDDGRVESVSRDVQARDRSGSTAEWEGKAEREGYGWEFEGEGKNRWGQDVEAEGYGARGYYGSGVVADIEGGRYGDRTVVAGRTYGGPTWARNLPYGARPYNYYGRSYYHYGGYYYRPYSYGGVPYYCYIPPPYYAYYPYAPVGAITIAIVGGSLLYADGSYYKETYVDGATQYQVVPAPADTTIPGDALPPERATITLAGQVYFLYGNTFYRQVLKDGVTSFVAVTKPAGIVAVEALPPEFEPVSVGSLTYFKTPERYYLTYLAPSGEELFVVVDPPPADLVKPVSQAGQPAATTPVAVAQPTLVPLTLQAGTPVTVRVATEINSATAQAGQRFQGHLDQALVVDGRLVAERSARVYGRVAEAKAGTGTGGKPSLALELTDITIGGRVVPLKTELQRFSAEGAKAGKKVLGGAALGAGIGAIIDGGEGAAWGAGIGAVAGTAKAASSPGNQVAVGAGTALEFRLAVPVTVEVVSQAKS